MIEGGKTPHTTTAELQEIGVAIELCGLTTLYAAAGGIRAALATLREDGITTAALPSMIISQEFNELVGLRRMTELEEEVIASSRPTTSARSGF
jgi:2-methylisocitrate lyase-like PEP mutase family enzyme